MATDKMTPGVYIEEINAFPGSAVAVETAVPVFIGYTETAMRRGKSLVGIPTSISSFAEYQETFGGAFHPKFKITQAAADAVPDPAAPTGDTTGTLNKRLTTLKLNDNNGAYFYNCIRLFYANGGGQCYIYSVGTYIGKDSFEIKAADFGETTVFAALEKEYEPTPHRHARPDLAGRKRVCQRRISEGTETLRQSEEPHGHLRPAQTGSVRRGRHDIVGAVQNRYRHHCPQLRRGLLAPG